MSMESEQVERSQEAVNTALLALAGAWRGSWADFDGRTLRSQLEGAVELSRRALKGEDVADDIAAYLQGWEICPTCRSWLEYCNCEEPEP